MIDKKSRNQAQDKPQQKMFLSFNEGLSLKF